MTKKQRARLFPKLPPSLQGEPLPRQHPPSARPQARPLRDAHAWLQPCGAPEGARLPSPAGKPSQPAPAFPKLLVNELRGF